MKEKIIYGLIYSIFWLISLFPFCILYVLANFIAFILYRVVKYRRSVVRTNLTNSFPDKTEKEIIKIEKQFYHYISDYFVEEIKMLTMSRKQMFKRMELNNLDIFLDTIDKHGGVIMMIPHYANFEWIVGTKMHMREEDQAVQVYKPLRNKYFDKLFQHLRSRFGGVNVAKHSTARELIRYKRAGTKIALGLIADQNPSKNDARFWTTFLNQDTVFMDGGERISKMMNYPVVYCDLERIKRGYGRVTFEVVTLEPKKTEEGYITQYFAEAIERTIARNPALWFWSHKRWKHKREEENA